MQSTRECSVDGCDRPFSCRDMCTLHYSRWRRTGTAEPPSRWPKGAVCAIDGCGKPRKGREWCSAHWLKWRKTGDPLTPNKVSGVDFNVKKACIAGDCDRHAHAHGYCHKHLRRWQKYGDPHTVGEITGRPLKGDVPTWAAIHKRLQRQRGSARQFMCVDCGSNASEWSYRGGSPSELVGNAGGFMCAYTEDLSYYDPRCTSCHRTYDGAGDRERTARGTFAGGKKVDAPQ